VEQLIANTLKRRPCTLSDLVSITGVHINLLNKYLGTMEEKGRIGVKAQERGDFYYFRR
jgi:DNA-binding IclR family transcriptional regulator